MNFSLDIGFNIAFQCNNDSTWNISANIHNGGSQSETFDVMLSNGVVINSVTVLPAETITIPTNLSDRVFFSGQNHIEIIQANSTNKKFFFLGECHDGLVYFAKQNSVCVDGRAGVTVEFSIKNNGLTNRTISLDYGDGSAEPARQLLPGDKVDFLHNYESLTRSIYQAFLHFNTNTRTPDQKDRIVIEFTRCPFKVNLGKLGLSRSCSTDHLPQIKFSMQPFPEDFGLKAIVDFGDGIQSPQFPLSAPPNPFEHTYPSSFDGQSVPIKFFIEGTASVLFEGPISLMTCNECGGVFVTATPLGNCHVGEQQLELKVKNDRSVPVSGQWTANGVSIGTPIDVGVGEEKTEFIFLGSGTYQLEFHWGNGCISKVDSEIVIDCPTGVCPTIDKIEVTIGKCIEGNKREVTASATINGLGVQRFLWEIRDASQSIVFTTTTSVPQLIVNGGLAIGPDFTVFLTIEGPGNCKGTQLKPFSLPKCGTENPSTNSTDESDGCLIGRKVIAALYAIAWALILLILCFSSGTTAFLYAAAAIAIVATVLLLVWLALTAIGICTQPCRWALQMIGDVLLIGGLIFLEFIPFGGLQTGGCCQNWILCLIVALLSIGIGFGLLLWWKKLCNVADDKFFAELLADLLIAVTVANIFSALGSIPLIGSILNGCINHLVTGIYAVLALVLLGLSRNNSSPGTPASPPMTPP